MRHFAVAGLMLLSAVLLGADAVTPAQNTTENLWSPTFSAWRYYLADHMVGLEDVWSFRDDVLVCKGEPMGYLYTKQAYGNFRLKVDYCWPKGVKPTNSGVFFRITGKPMPLPHCYEAQLQNGNAGDIYGFQGKKLNGPADRLKSVKGHELGGDLTGVRKIEGNEKEPGEWNTIEVQAEGPSIKIWLNGKLVNEATDAETKPGPIALQSEGGEVHFRNLQIKRLPD